MSAQKSIDEVVAEIAASQLPAVVIDTCAALDVIRSISRGAGRIVGIVLQVIDAHRAGELLLYAHSVLLKETDRNRVEVEAEARKQARAVDEAIGQYRRAAQYLGTHYPYVDSHAHDSVIPSLTHLHNELLAASVHISPERKILAAAFARCSDNRRPSRKGGGANDCLMFEEFRTIAHAVPTADPLVLLTTNPDDFVDKSRGKSFIHDDITDDLAGTQGRVCLNWDWAVGQVLSAERLKRI